MIFCSSELYSKGLVSGAVDGLFGEIVACGHERSGMRMSHGRGPGNRFAFHVGGDSQSEQGEDCGSRVDRFAFRCRPGARPAPDRATTPSGRCVPGRFGSGSSQTCPT